MIRPAHYRFLLLLICGLAILFQAQACTRSFFDRPPSQTPAGPPTIKVDFDSATATALLTWNSATERRFLRYVIQRNDGEGFFPIATIQAVDDTSFVDTGLQANWVYRYRVASYFGSPEAAAGLLSDPAQGGFHRYLDAWRVGEPEEPFLPTRMVIDSRGVVSIVGAGSGRLARFDTSGQPLGWLTFSTEPLACLATSGLDGPSVALDPEDYIYVIFNVQRSRSRPEAFWAKYDPSGKLVWTRPLEGLFARHIVIADDQIFIESISQLQQFDRHGERQKQYLVPPLLVATLRFWSGRFAALIEPLHILEGDWQAPRLVVYEGPERQTAALVIGRDPVFPQDQGNGLLQRPTDFIVDEGSGRSFVVNAGLQRVEVFLGDKFLTRWGRDGDQPGRFRFTGRTTVIDDIAASSTVERKVVAGGIARDRQGHIYIADTFNNRIQKFQP